MMNDKREKVLDEIDKIKRQIKNARLQIRGREYVWPRQSAGFKRLKKDLEEKIGALEEELANE